MTDFQKLAVDQVREKAGSKVGGCRTYLESVCSRYGVDVEKLIDRMLQNAVTVNFHGKLLNQVVSSEREALAVLLYKSDKMKVIGRNLDNCIETHIHGEVSLGDDVDRFYMDESFRETEFAQTADELCKKYQIELERIPKRQIEVEEIGELFRGPMIPLLAKKIDMLYGSHQGIMNASLLGKASRDSELYPEKWKDIGSESEVFQYIKQLWHTICYFGW